MPKKSAKKRKEKEQDFQKTKLKVGKKKVAADNFTDTSFRSQAILLPNQGLKDENERTAAPVNRKNQTLNDLTIQLKHYNAAVRKDALHGIKDLFQRFPEILVPSLGILANFLVRLLVDEDEPVRKALHSLLTGILPHLSTAALTPFMPLFITYTTSAMAHIFDDIRLDAIKFMALWIDVAPGAVVEQAERIFPNYLALLGASTEEIAKPSTGNPGGVFGTSGTGKGRLMSYKRKVEILTGLHHLLEAWAATKVNVTTGYSEERTSNATAVQKQKSKMGLDGLWYFRPFVSSTSSISADLLLGPSTDKPVLVTSPFSAGQPMPEHRATNLLLNPTYSHLGLFANTSSDRDSKSSQSSSSSTASTSYDNDPRLLLSNLYPVLLSTWLDAAPSAFIEHGTASGDALQSCAVVVKLLGLIWRSWIVTGGFEKTNERRSDDDKTWLQAHFKGVLKHFMGYFPFGKDRRSVNDSKTESLLQEMNAIFCELVALFLLASERASGEAVWSDNEDGIPPWADHVVGYLLDSFGWQDGPRQMVKELKPENVTALLPATWCLMNALSGGRRDEVLEAVINRYKVCHISSSTKKILAEFLARAFTVQNHPQYVGPLKVSSTCDASDGRIPPFSQYYKDWSLSIPRTVWELRSNSPRLSAILLRALTRLCIVYGRSDDDGGPETNVDLGEDSEKSSPTSQTATATASATTYLTSLRNNMIPFFHVSLTRPSGEVKTAFGPFVKAPSYVQKAALDVVTATGTVDASDTPDSSCSSSWERFRRAIDICMEDPDIPIDTREYVEAMYYHRRSSAFR